MPSRRDLIKMTSEEADAFLHETHTMNVATIGRDGRPHLVAMWYGFLGDAPAFWTFGKSQKVVNLERDPRITCLVEAGDVYAELRGVELVGTRHRHHRHRGHHRDRVEHLAAAHRCRSRSVAARSSKRRRASGSACASTSSKVVSWDHRKLEGRY